MKKALYIFLDLEHILPPEFPTMFFPSYNPDFSSTHVNLHFIRDFFMDTFKMYKDQYLKYFILKFPRMYIPFITTPTVEDLFKAMSKEGFQYKIYKLSKAAETLELLEAIENLVLPEDSSKRETYGIEVMIEMAEDKDMKVEVKEEAEEVKKNIE